MMNRDLLQKGILQVTFNSPKAKDAQTGLRTLQLDAKRDDLLYVPPAYKTAQSTPLAVMLHGAGGDAQHGMSLLQPLADAYGIIILAPYARAGTWDIIEQERFGPDVFFISQAIQEVVDQYSINIEKVAIGGFSDGASYALSLGLLNGTLFTHILAFSPGFYYAPELKGQPNIYISHGEHDEVLPIQYCSRRLVPRLQKLGYAVLYHEFDGPHILPDAVRQEAVNWFLDTREPAAN